MEISERDLKSIGDALENKLSGISKFAEHADTVMQELKARMTDVEQKLARKPGGDLGYGLAQPGAIIETLRASDGFKALLAGNTKEARIPLPAGSLETKTAILGPVVPGAAALQAPDRGGFVGAAQRRLLIRALMPSIPTNAGSTQYSRLSAFTNNAQPQGSGSSPSVREGEVKGESGMVFELVTSDIVTMAHWIPASKQVLDDMAALEAFIQGWMLYGLALKTEDQILNGSGSSGSLQGLLSVATAYNRGNSNDTPLDTLRKSITQLALAEHIASGIVVNPADWEGIELAKDNEGQYIMATLNANGREVAWRVPVVVTNSIEEGTFLTGDFSAAVIRDREQAAIEISNSHQDFFVRNMVAIRCEERLGLEIHRPAGFVTGSLPSV